MRGREIAGLQSDGAQIPLREAFRWQRDADAPGAATWYAGTGPWWTNRVNRSGDGVSVQEQDTNPQSLLNFYRSIAAIRAERPEFAAESIEPACLDGGPVFCFYRRAGSRWSWIAVNLADAPARAQRPGPGAARDLLGERLSGESEITLPAWGMRIIGSP